MKKLLALILVLSLVLGMGMVASAEPGEKDNSISLYKIYKLENDGTKSPAETFVFDIANAGVTHSQYTLNDMPGFGEQQLKIVFTEGEATLSGDSNSGTLNLPDYEHVGIFTYKLTEVNGNTAGVSYDEGKFMKVQVTNKDGGGFNYSITLYEIGEEGNVGGKVTAFENKFSAGDLEIKKEVTGNMGEKDRVFHITVTLTAPSGKDMTKVPITVNGVESYLFADGSNSKELDLTFSEENPITIQNLPYGVAWSLEEENLTDEGYDEAEYSLQSGTIGDPSVEVTVTNKKSMDVPTGINLDNLPYILIIGAVTIGLVGFTMKRRLSNR